MSTSNRKFKIKGRGLSMVLGGYVKGFDGRILYDKQIAMTLGLMRDYGQTDLEALINFNAEKGGHLIIETLFSRIKNGERFSEGDKTKILIPSQNEEVEIVFRKSENCYGPCLRAVVVGVEEELQKLPFREAAEAIDRSGELYDPFESLSELYLPTI